MITIRDTAFDFNAGLDAIERIEHTDLGKTLPSRPWAEFPAHEYGRRYARLRTLMEREGIDCAVFTQEENVRYFSGYLSVLWVSKFRPLMALLPADVSVDGAVLVSGQEMENARGTSWVENPTVFSPQHPPMPHLAQLLTDMVGDRARVGIELGFGQRLGLNIEQLRELESLVPGIELVDITPLSECVRMLKSDLEVDLLRTSSEISCQGVRAGWEALREGVSEHDIASVIGARMLSLGAEIGSARGSFLGIMAGSRLLFSNALATDRETLSAGDMVLIDGGASYKGYLTDFIRQASLGPMDPEARRWLDVAIEANHRAIDAVRPGAVASDVYETAMVAFGDHGLREFNRMTIIGHGIGADVHELPWIGEGGIVYTSDTVLREGMVLAIEPALGSPGQGPFGRFIVENIVAVTADGTELLTASLPDSMWYVDA